MRLKSHQARRVLVELNPTLKRVGSELDAVRAEGVRARRADASRRAAAAVMSGRAQARGSAGDWGYGARPGPPPRALHQRTTNRNPPPDRQRTDPAITISEDRYELRPPRATRHRQNTIALRLMTVSPR